MPELLAQEYPLRFLNMRGAFTVGYISLLGDAIGVGHAAWAFYFVTRRLFCRAHYEDQATNGVQQKQAPGLFVYLYITLDSSLFSPCICTIVLTTVHSAELLAKTGSPLGHSLEAGTGGASA